MKTAGIIVEYNPFHNGHNYHIDRTRSITGADYVIAVMSGDYTQRGCPAVTDKYSRAKMALQNGVDLVLELPLFYACGSAEYFAMGAVSLLDKLGMVDSLCFGSECGDIPLLSQTAASLTTESEGYQQVLQTGIKSGLSYPKARYLAISSCCPAGIPAAISSPNNILGIEYLKALQKRNSTILPYTIKREGSDYHDTSLSASFGNRKPQSSASAIRRTVSLSPELSAVKAHVPPSVYAILKEINGKSFPIDSRDFSILLKYKLLLDASGGYTEYMDVTEDLSDKIRKNLNRYENYEQFCDILKSKDITYTRLSRCLLHILLNIRKVDFAFYAENDYISYARILGFKKESANLLGNIKKHASLPLISKLADAAPLLDEAGTSMLEKEILASHIYSSVTAAKFSVPFLNEYERQMIIL